MKWLLCLLSLYMLLLSGIPCNADGCCDDETSAAAHTSGHPDKKASCPCSPFFACCSCHGVVAPDEQPVLAVAQPVLSPLHVYYTGSSLRDFPASIWQPPQLG